MKTDPLQQAARLQAHALDKGFRFQFSKDYLNMIVREVMELQDTIIPTYTSGNVATKEELGDVLMATVAAAVYLGVSPTVALQEACERFEKRFEVASRFMSDNDLNPYGELHNWLTAWCHAKKTLAAQHVDKTP